jgi:hypothetical protein
MRSIDVAASEPNLSRENRPRHLPHDLSLRSPIPSRPKRATRVSKCFLLSQTPARNTDQSRHTACQETLPRRRNHLLPLRPRPIHPKPRHTRQLPYKLSLRPPIPFPKWMHRINLSQVKGRSLDEWLARQPTQIPFLRQLPKQIIHARLHKIRTRERMPTLGNIHRAKLTRPSKYVLKNVIVNRS